MHKDDEFRGSTLRCAARLDDLDDLDDPATSGPLDVMHLIPDVTDDAIPDVFAIDRLPLVHPHPKAPTFTLPHLDVAGRTDESEDDFLVVGDDHVRTDQDATWPKWRNPMDTWPEYVDDATTTMIVGAIPSPLEPPPTNESIPPDARLPLTMRGIGPAEFASDHGALAMSTAPKARTLRPRKRPRRSALVFLGALSMLVLGLSFFPRESSNSPTARGTGAESKLLPHLALTLPMAPVIRDLAPVAAGRIDVALPLHPDAKEVPPSRNVSTPDRDLDVPPSTVRAKAATTRVAVAKGTDDVGRGSESEILARAGDSAMHAEEPARALFAYRDALRSNPFYLPARIGAADANWALGNKDSARETYRNIIDDYPARMVPTHVRERAYGKESSAK